MSGLDKEFDVIGDMVQVPTADFVMFAAAADVPRGIKTLHDEYAMAALTGLVAVACDSSGFRLTVEARVKLARRYADAMMAERGK